MHANAANGRCTAGEEFLLLQPVACESPLQDLKFLKDISTPSRIHHYKAKGLLG